MAKMFMKKTLPTLFKDGTHDDRPALQALLNGRAAYDKQEDLVIFANDGLKSLPPGCYRMCAETLDESKELGPGPGTEGLSPEPVGRPA